MRKLFRTITMSALGAAAMYYMDPDRGHRRRAQVRDRLGWMSHEAGEFMHDQRQRAAYRLKGMAASARRPFARTERHLDDDLLLGERVRAEMDRLMSHPNVMDRAGAAMAELPRGSTLLGSLFKVVALCAASAAAMYYLDPQMGRQRRGLVSDKLNSMSHNAGDYARAKGKLAADRIKGAAASARAPFARLAQPRSDRQLRERIRAQLGRVVSHPKAIEVLVNQGSVSLSGHVLAAEVDELLSMVHAMTGVQHVDNRLEVHAEPGNIPALQSGDHHVGAVSRGTSDTGTPHWH